MVKNKGKIGVKEDVPESSFPVKNCRTMNICQLLKILTRRKLSAVKWLQRIGLLDNVSCCDNCGKRMSLVLRQSISGVRTDKYEWECTKCRMCTRNLRDGTLFQSSKLSLQKLTMMIYFWAHNFPSHVAQRELCLSERTVKRWYRICQEACVDALVNNSSKIGGEGRHLEVFENKLDRRMTDMQIAPTEHPVIGVIDVEDGSCFLQLVKSTPKSTLLTILRKRIENGSTLYSENWETYDCFNDEQFSRAARHRKLVLKNRRDETENTFKKLYAKVHAHDDADKKFSFDSLLCGAIYKTSKISEPFYFVKFLGEIGTLYRERKRLQKLNQQTDASEKVPGPCSYQRSIVIDCDDMDWSSSIIDFPGKKDVSKQNNFQEIQNATSDDPIVLDDIIPQQSSRSEETECTTAQLSEMETVASNECAVVKDEVPQKECASEHFSDSSSDASNDVAAEEDQTQYDSKSGDSSDDNDTEAVDMVFLKKGDEPEISDKAEKNAVANSVPEQLVRANEVVEPEARKSEESEEIKSMSRTLAETCIAATRDSIELVKAKEGLKSSSISGEKAIKPGQVSEVQKSVTEKKTTDEPKHNDMSEEILQNIEHVSQTQDSPLEAIVMLEKSDEPENTLPENSMHSSGSLLKVDSDMLDEPVPLNETVKVGNNKKGSIKVGSLKDGPNKESNVEQAASTSRVQVVIDMCANNQQNMKKGLTGMRKEAVGPVIDVVNIDDADSDVEVLGSEASSVADVTIVRASQREVKSYERITHHERRLLIDNIPCDMSKSILKNYFVKFGKILFLKMLPDPDRKPMRYGIIEFSTKNVINNIQAARPHYLDTKTPLGTFRGYSPNINISLNTRQVKTVLVSIPNHDTQMPAEDLWQHFTHYGHISYIEKVTRVTGIGAETGSTSFTVCFEDYDSADVACMNNPHVIKGVLNISCKKEQKDEVCKSGTNNEPIYVENDSDVEELQLDNNSRVQSEAKEGDNNVCDNSSSNEDHPTGNKRPVTEENDSGRKKLCNDEKQTVTAFENILADPPKKQISAADSTGEISGPSNRSRLGSNENNFQIKQEIPDWRYCKTHQIQKRNQNRRAFSNMCRVHQRSVHNALSVNGNITNERVTIGAMQAAPSQRDGNPGQRQLQQVQQQHHQQRQPGHNFHNKKRTRNHHHQFRPYQEPVAGAAGSSNPLQHVLPEGIPLMMNAGMAVPSHVTRSFPQQIAQCPANTRAVIPQINRPQNRRL